MTPADVTRLYHLLDALRHESKQSAQEIRDEVQGYRRELNGRLRALEQAEAHRTGKDTGHANIGKVMWGACAISASLATVIALALQAF